MNKGGQVAVWAVAGLVALAPVRRVVAAPTSDESPPATDDEAPADPATDPASIDAPGQDAEPAAESPPAATPPAKSRSVWASPEPPDADAPPAGVAGPAPTPAPTADDDDDDDLDDSPIGGYLHATETKELPPPDGHRQIIAGSILVPLGTLATATGALSVWATNPDHCRERLDRLGSQMDDKHCPGLYVLNIIRVSYGSLMLASGAVLLGIGLNNRKRHREWNAKHHTAFVPIVTKGFRGVSWSLRF